MTTLISKVVIKAKTFKRHEAIQKQNRNKEMISR